METNTQATEAARGYVYQAYYGVFFIFYEENYKKIKSIKIDGKHEDIEIRYRDGSIDLIQAKTSYNMDSEDASSKFKVAMMKLRESSGKIKKVKKIIYVNNLIDQRVERLTNAIKNGFIKPGLVNIKNNLSSEERKKLIGNIKFTPSFEFTEKYHLCRIDDKFLKREELIPQLEEALLKLEVHAGMWHGINSEYKEILVDNMTGKARETDIEQIAWVLIKKINRLDSIFDKFNKIYQVDLEELGLDEICDIVNDSSYFMLMIEKRNNYFMATLHFEKLVIIYCNSKGKFKLEEEDIKEFSDSIVEELKKRNYLNYSEMDYSPKYEDILYKLYIFILYSYKKKNEKYREAFLLEEVINNENIKSNNRI